MLFKQTRIDAFVLWQEGTNRDCRFVNDDITGSFECKWQDIAREDHNYEHISIFCSLGEWANNISDILQEDTRDNYNFLDDDHRQALFRYYTRLLLVVSEILSDFEEIVKKFEGYEKPKKAREFLSGYRGEVDSWFGFINTICKHKVGNIHRCNHHLDIGFDDFQQSQLFDSPISIGKINFDQPDCILVPKLSEIIQVVLNCYARLNDLFENENEKFLLICDEYSLIIY